MKLFTNQSVLPTTHQQDVDYRDQGKTFSSECFLSIDGLTLFF